MWQEFFLENLHFGINLIASLAFFSVFWLYFDSWLERKTLRDGLKVLGYLLLSIGFLVGSVYIDSGSLLQNHVVLGLPLNIFLAIKLAGYIFLSLGLLIDPLTKKPSYHALFMSNIASGVYFVIPVFTAFNAWLYLKRATIGLESHLKRVALAFFIFSIYELLETELLFSGSNNLVVFNLTRPFGPLWILTLAVELIAALFLLKWAFSYLLKRINTQLFIIFSSFIILIFLVTAVAFTFILFKNLRDETLSKVQTDASVLSYAIDAKKAETLSDAQILAQDPEVIDALNTNDKKVLNTKAQKTLIDKKLNSVLILNNTGLIISRGEDAERTGDSLSSDPLVKKALMGQTVNTLSAKEYSTSAIVLVGSAVPINNQGSVIGAIIVYQTLDNNFLDGIKAKTGLTASIYAGEVLSATTIKDSSAKTRPIGIKEQNKFIKTIVLNQGQEVKEEVSILNNTYFAAYTPLLDSENSPVGMLFVGSPAAGIYALAIKSIETTFALTVVLIVLFMAPSYFISKNISDQIK